MHHLTLATLCSTRSRKRRSADAVQTARKRSKEAPAAASPRGPVAIHQGLGLELPSVQVENMDDDGRTEAATIPVSAFASAPEPHASLAATKPLAASHPTKSAATNEPKRRRGRPPKAIPLPQRSSAPATDTVLEPHRPVRKSANSARPAELLSIPKRSKADLINWSTTATANKRLKTCEASAQVSGTQAPSPATRGPGASAGLRAGSGAAQACRASMDIRLDQLPAAILRPFWPKPSHLLPHMLCTQHPPDQQNINVSCQQTPQSPPASADAVDNASQPAVAGSTASDAVDAPPVATGNPDAIHVASSGSSPQQPARRQEPLVHLPEACDQPNPRKGIQKQGICTAEEIDSAAQKLAALLQGPQPLLSGVVHAFGHAICACSAVLPACATPQRQLGTGDSASQTPQSAAADHDQMVSPELHFLAPLWLSTAALSGFGLTALLHLACRVDENLSRLAQTDPDQPHIPAAGAQQASGQVETSAADNTSPPATTEGMFLEELRRHLHFKSLASLAAAHCSSPRGGEVALLQSRSGTAAEPAPAPKPISSLGEACQGQRTVPCGLLPTHQCLPNAALDALEEAASDIPPQAQKYAASTAGTSAAAMQGSNSATAAATAAVQLAAPTSPVNTSEASAQPDTGADVGGHQCTDAAVDKLAAADAAVAPASSVQPPPVPAITGPSEACEGGQQGTAAPGLQGVEDVSASLAAITSPASIQQKLFPGTAAAAQGVEGHDGADTTPQNLSSTSTPAAQPAPLNGAGCSQAGFVTKGAGDADKANGASSSSPSPLSTLDSQHAATLCLASGSLCKIMGKRRVSRLQQTFSMHC